MNQPKTNWAKKNVRTGHINIEPPENTAKQAEIALY
jgi:hypothetical protein